MDEPLLDTDPRSFSLEVSDGDCDAQEWVSDSSPTQKILRHGENDEEDADRLRRLGAYNLGNHGNRWGWRFDPEQPIFRVWTNIRGRKVHYAMFTWTVLLLVATLGCRYDGVKINSIFTAHVVMMLMCWLLMSEGLIAYRAGELGTATVESLRSTHRVLMTFAGVFMLCGIVAILAHKRDMGKSVVPSSLHAICGTVTFLLTIGQAWSGVKKHTRFLLNQGKSYRWHGNTGQALYGILVITAVLGFLELRDVTVLGVWLFFITVAATSITVMAAMYQPTSLGGDQHDQVNPTRDVGEHDVELLSIE
eukprot:m.59788 g.59788  ORF g.59788 m.59788 type:complete len:306 (-) comp9478_c0_seq1:1578-2495(-)